MASREQRNQVKDLCNPKKTLPPSDLHVIDLDEVGRGQVRGFRWSEELNERLDPTLEATEPLFFTGLRGSGKTTELLRARDRLLRDGWFAVCVDLGEYLSLSEPVALADVLTMLVYAVERQVVELEGGDPDVVLPQGFLGRVWGELTQTTATIKELEIGLGILGTSGKVKYELKTKAEPRRRLRELVERSLARYLDLVRKEVQSLDARVVAKGYNGLVVFADGLEKLSSSMHETWGALAQSAVHLFVHQVEQLELPVRTLYTVPPWVAHRMRVDGLLYLPMVKLHEKNGARFEKGYSTMRQLLGARVSEDLLGALLGEDVERRVDRMITESGGYVRELLQIVSEVASEPRELDDDAFEHRLSSVRNRMRSAIKDSRKHALLARFHVRKDITVESDEERLLMERLIAQNAVLFYCNKEQWFDIHPALLDYGWVREQITRFQEQQ